MAAAIPFLEQKRINFRDPLLKQPLTNLQCNILKGHGRDHAWHIFLRLDTQSKGAIRRYSQLLTSCYTQLTQSDKRKKELEKNPAKPFDGGLIRSLLLSSGGYKQLGLPHDIWSAEQPGWKPFKTGMKHR